MKIIDQGIVRIIFYQNRGDRANNLIRKSAMEKSSAGNVARRVICSRVYWTKGERTEPSRRGAVFFCATRYNYWGLVTFAEARTAVKYLVRASPRSMVDLQGWRLPQSNRFAYSTSKQRKCKSKRRRKRWKIKDRKQRQRPTSKSLYGWVTRVTKLFQHVNLQSACK